MEYKLINKKKCHPKAKILINKPKSFNGCLYDYDSWCQMPYLINV